MLGKLLKYEFKNTAKVMLTIYGVLIITTLLGSLGLSTDAIQSDTAELPPIIELLFISSIMLYILSIFALFLNPFQLNPTYLQQQYKAYYILQYIDQHVNPDQ